METMLEFQRAPHFLECKKAQLHKDSTISLTLYSKMIQLLIINLLMSLKLTHSQTSSQNILLPSIMKFLM